MFVACKATKIILPFFFFEHHSKREYCLRSYGRMAPYLKDGGNRGVWLEEEILSPLIPADAHITIAIHPEVGEEGWMGGGSQGGGQEEGGRERGGRREGGGEREEGGREERGREEGGRREGGGRERAWRKGGGREEGGRREGERRGEQGGREEIRGGGEEGRCKVVYCP